MKENQHYSAEYLHHLEQYTHFMDEYSAKTVCSDKDECKTYKRLEDGGNSSHYHQVNHKCHRQIFRHPPKRRDIKLQDNVNAFITNTSDEQNHDYYKPTASDKQQYNWNKRDGYLGALMEEMIVNGVGSDLCLKCDTRDECQHLQALSKGNDYYGGEFYWFSRDDYEYIFSFLNVYSLVSVCYVSRTWYYYATLFNLWRSAYHAQHSVLRFVDKKMNEHRHKQMGKPLNRAQMLSIILFTGETDCNYYLCESQRNG
eukprot:903272_1